MASWSKIGRRLLGEDKTKVEKQSGGADFSRVAAILLDPYKIETRALVTDYRVTHAVEVDRGGRVRRVLCGGTKPENISFYNCFNVPTCPACVHIDALPVTCPTSSPRWFDLEMRRIAADPVDRARVAAEDAARAAAEEEQRARAERAAAARAAAEAAQEERARADRALAGWIAEAARLCALAPENARAREIARAGEVYRALPPPQAGAIRQWYQRAVEAQRRAEAAERARPREVETQRVAVERRATPAPRPLPPAQAASQPQRAASAQVPTQANRASCGVSATKTPPVQPPVVRLPPTTPGAQEATAKPASSPLAERILAVVAAGHHMSINGILKALATVGGQGARRQDVYAEVGAMLTDGRLVKLNDVFRPGPVR